MTTETDPTVRAALADALDAVILLQTALNAANATIAERDAALEAIETLAAKGAQTELYEPLRRLWQQVEAIARGAKGETP